VPSNNESSNSGSALSRRLLAVFAQPPTEADLEAARQRLAEAPKLPHPTGGVIWVEPRRKAPPQE
jgi:hypothetical protein